MDEDTVTILGKQYPKGVRLKTMNPEMVNDARRQGFEVRTSSIQFGFEGLERTEFAIFTGVTKCHAPDASDDGRKLSGIGEQQSNGLSQMDVLIQLLKLSEKQSQQLYELTQGMEFLAQQVKTLVDALAEEEDTDMPMTNYLSGKPI